MWGVPGSTGHSPAIVLYICSPFSQKSPYISDTSAPVARTGLAGTAVPASVPSSWSEPLDPTEPQGSHRAGQGHSLPTVLPGRAPWVTAHCTSGEAPAQHTAAGGSSLGARGREHLGSGCRSGQRGPWGRGGRPSRPAEHQGQNCTRDTKGWDQWEGALKSEATMLTNDN